ncbi:MAG: hypothetical protein ACYC5H_08450 [Methylovirgula sp.]
MRSYLMNRALGVVMRRRQGRVNIRPVERVIASWPTYACGGP